MKKALITGITGQDGSYLAELLLAKGYEVHGIIRRASTFNTERIEHLYQDPHEKNQRLFLHYGDLTDGSRLVTLLSKIQPDEVYNLAAQSHVRVSFDEPEYTGDTTGLGTVRLLEAIRLTEIPARFYQASSSEMFGAASPPQNEKTEFHPRSPYGVSKLYSHWIARNYRESYGLYAASGILFNHESERRPLHFVTQKIAYGAACAALGINESPDLNERGHPIVADGRLSLGNLDIARDWGHAIDFVRAMWLIVQQERPDDFVVGTGELHTLRQLCQAAYGRVDLNWQDHVVSDPALVRPLETGQTLADASKARNVLNWKPTVSFEQMVSKMVDAQIARLESRLRGLGITVPLNIMQSNGGVLPARVAARKPISTTPRSRPAARTS
jgi:GDPmannose 4,6-dehydratase